MIKKVKYLNYGGAALMVVHAISCANFTSQLGATMNIVDITRELAPQMPPSYIWATLFLFITGFATSIVSIIALIFNIQLPRGNKGKVWGIVAASVSLGGMLVGIIPIVNIVFAGAQGILYILAGYFMNKSQDVY